MTVVPRGAATRVRNLLLGLVAAAVVATVVIRPATGESIAGSAGTDTTLPATASQVTVSGRGAFSDLRITVNQTRNLVNQAISVTWTGGKPTPNGGAVFDDNYLQIMQCWGDDDGSIPDNPGPPPEQCVQGASGGMKGGVAVSGFPSGSFAMHRIVSRQDYPDVFDPSEGILEKSTGYVWKPFRAVDGKEIGVQADQNCSPDIQGCAFWLNPYFNIVTTNEIPGALTGPNGEGAELFEVTTGVESSGLGCGQLLTPAGGGTPRVPRCWLVVVPRGDREVENAGLPVGVGATGVVMSPLSARAWANRVAIPLEFNPVDSPCDFSAEPRQIAGSELASLAVASWQPKLCSTQQATPYAYAGVADERARRQLLADTPGGPGMAVVSRPVDPALVDSANPVVYAPLTLSATVIGFNVERNPHLEADRAEQDLAGTRVAEINLTPRLVAKLLTQSYRSQVTIFKAPPYGWVEKNPPHLGSDPDFLQFNPEFSLLQHASPKNFGGLLVPAGNFDHARRLWEYVLADPEARAWLDGQDDPWGMQVNPFYATTADKNAGGVAFGEPVPGSFPKSDPYCYQAPPRPAGGTAGNPMLTPAPFCGTDWLPYMQSLRETARQTRLADDGAKVNEDSFAQTADQIFKKDLPQRRGVREILSITDSPSASRYGIQTARLSRAGDDAPTRTFIAGDVAGMTAAVGAMVPREDPSVLEPNPMAAVAGAYPLTHLTYGAVTPFALSDQERQDYAAFIEYAAGPGQDTGPDPGQLPEGFAPLPEHLRAQAVSAASVIRQVETAQPDSPTSQTQPESTTSQAPIEVAPARAPSTLTSPVSGGEPADLPISSRQPDQLQPMPLASEPVAMSRAATAVDVAKEFLTPILGMAMSRFALPFLGALAFVAALAALEISKRPRPAVGSQPPSAERGEAP